MIRIATPRFARCSLLALYVSLGCVANSLAGDDPPANRPPEAVLHLTDGESLPGVFAASDVPGTIVFRPDTTGGLREFNLSELNVVEFPAPSEKRRPDGDCEFVLDTGDRLTGSLKSIKDDTAELAVAHLGTISIPVQRLRQISFLRNAVASNLVAPGEEKKVAGVTAGGVWREEAGFRTTGQAGAFYQRDSILGDRAEIEIELSWLENPDFDIILGHGTDPESLKNSFRIDVWASDLVLAREVAADGDVALVRSLAKGPGNLRLTIFLDQVAQQCSVSSSDGRQLAKLKVRDETVNPRPALRIANKRGDLRLKLLRVRPWDGRPVSKPKSDEWRVERADGSFVTGSSLAFDAPVNRFLLKSERESVELPAGDVVDLLFRTDRKPEPAAVSALYHDGTRISGNVLRVDAATLWMSTPGVKEVRVPFAGMKRLQKPSQKKTK